MLNWHIVAFPVATMNHPFQEMFENAFERIRHIDCVFLSFAVNSNVLSIDYNHSD